VAVVVVLGVADWQECLVIRARRSARSGTRCAKAEWVVASGQQRLGERCPAATAPASPGSRSSFLRFSHEMLGHATVAISLDLYSHAGEDMHQEAADLSVVRSSEAPTVTVWDRSGYPQILYIAELPTAGLGLASVAMFRRYLRSEIG
jgi:hypothetical protein